MPLPIMLFDESKLKPTFGYVFDRKWIHPHESIVSILWKLVRQNRIPGHMIAFQFAREVVDPYEGIAVCETQLDIGELNKVLSIPAKVIRESLLPDSLQRSSSPWLRHCRRCVKDGYHSVVHQLNRVGKCPVHDLELNDTCQECGERTPYRLNARLLDSPYRCSHCRKPYSSCVPKLTASMPMSKLARRAITRVRLGSGARP